MEKILDLGAFQEHACEIKLPNGHMLRLQQPSKKHQIQMMSYQDKVNDGNSEAILNEMTILILNTNSEKLTFKTKTGYVFSARTGLFKQEHFTLSELQKTAICEYYASWIASLLSSPN